MYKRFVMDVCHKYLLLMIWFLQFAGNLKAQDNTIGKVSISSPTAASLGKFGDIPVDYHTGVPQVNIPLYTIKSGSLTLPVTLDYHASGLKVQEPAGWVGVGWVLNAGGVITRSVMGGPDEAGTASGLQEDYGFFSHNGMSKYLNRLQIYPSPSQNVPDWPEFVNGHKDGQPDLFFFNFSGYAGKFYFNDDRTPVIVPEQDLKITPYFPEAGKSIQGFTITTPDGTQYLFGKTEGFTGAVNPYEITNPLTYQGGASSSTIISSWYLAKIQSVDRQFSIGLSYVQENYGYHTIANKTKYSGDPQTNTNQYDYDLVKNLVNGVRLSAINFANGTVTFNPGDVRQDLSSTLATLEDQVNTSASALGSMTITGTNGYCKNFQFTYSYFEDLTTPLTGYFGGSGFSYNLHTDQKRLKLQSVQETACNSTDVIPPYVFDYYSELVPRRLSFGVDHWGFANGITNNDKVAPTITVAKSGNPLILNGANREPSWPEMRGGTLKRITYPTNGTTSFEFEGNTVSTQNIQPVLNKQAEIYVGYSQSNNVFVSSQSFSVADNPTMYYTYYLDLSVNEREYDGMVQVINQSNGTEVFKYYFQRIKPDHWGTYQTFYLTPSQRLSLPGGNYTLKVTLDKYSYYNDNNNPNTANCMTTQACIPTGFGVTAMVFKDDQSVSTVTSLVGGLRIKTITSYSGNATAPPMTTNYDYSLGTGSSGILYGIPVYAQVVRNDIHKQLGYWDPAQGYHDDGLVADGMSNGCITGPEPSYVTSGGSIRPMATTQGYHIGYRNVKVSRSGAGSILYEYNVNTYEQPAINDISVRKIDVTICLSSFPNYPSPPLPFENLRGKLKSETYYSESGKILKNLTYVYEYEDAPIKTHAGVFTSCNGNIQATYFDWNTQHLTQEKVIQSNYSTADNSAVQTVTTKFYESALHHAPTKTIVLNSNNDELATHIKYAFDFEPPSTASIDPGWTQYKTSFDACSPAYQNEIQGCPSSSQDKYCPTRVYLHYIDCQNKARTDYVDYRTSTFNPGYASTFQSAFNTADNILQPILELKKDYINSPVETSSTKKDYLLKSTFLKYQNAPVIDPLTNQSLVKSYPSEIRSIGLKSPSTSLINAAVSNNTITTDSRYESMPDATFVYDKGNVVETKGRDGVTTSYLWGYHNSLPVAKVIGANYQTIHNLISSPNTLDNPSDDLSMRTELAKVRTGLASTKGMVTTYTYNPLSGMTSQTDAQARTSYYEYDNLARLATLKDQNQKIVKRYEYKYNNSVSGNSVYTAENLSNLIANYMQIQPGGLNHTVATSVDDQKFFHDTRDFVFPSSTSSSINVVRLPDAERNQSSRFYSGFNLNLGSPYYTNNMEGLCFMSEGYSVEWRMRMPQNNYRNRNVYYVNVNFGFAAIFSDFPSGTYLSGYQDFDGNKYGADVGGTGFQYINVKPDNSHTFDDFHKIKLEVTLSTYKVYYDDVIIHTQSRGTNTPAIDTRLYLDANFLGNDWELDYVKVMDKYGTPKLLEDFNNASNPKKFDPSLICNTVLPDCQTAFANYFNEKTYQITPLTFTQITALYLNAGVTLNVCN